MVVVLFEVVFVGCDGEDEDLLVGDAGGDVVVKGLEEGWGAGESEKGGFGLLDC